MWEDIEKERIKRIIKSLTVVGTVSLLLPFLIMVDYLRLPKTQFPILYALFFGVVLVIYLFYSTAISSLPIYSANSKFGYSGLIVLTLIVGIFVYITGDRFSPAKLLFIIPVLIYSIRYGRRASIASAFMSTAGIYIIDTLHFGRNRYNPYFEQDIITIAIIWIVGWVIADLNETENQIRNYLTNLAQMDELTGLLNHRSFQESLEKALSGIGTVFHSLSLILVDIDDFKKYNDLYGHQQGDKVLKKIALVLQRTFKSPAILARFGGDEFAVIVPDIDESACNRLTDTFRKEVEKLSPQEIGTSIGITVTAGFSTMKTITRREELIRMADMALYKGKNSTKNRVELYHSILEELKVEIGASDDALLNTIRTLLAVVNAKDRYTYGHSERLVEYVTQVGQHIGLSAEEVRILRYAAFLHDIGKVEIPDTILNKQGPLTTQEWEIMEKHPIWGANIISPLEGLSSCVPLIMHHHERYDGSGYPHGLKGDEIPFGARILALADTFDAMSTDRPYQKRKEKHVIIQEIIKLSGKSFDPFLAGKFVECIEHDYVKFSSHVFPFPDTIQQPRDE